MTKAVSFAKMNLKLNADVKTIAINNNTEIEVKQYLPVADKLAIITASIYDGYEEGIINPLLLDVNFYLNVVFKYTNIAFTDKQKEDKFKLYDILETNDIFALVMKNIPDEEWTTLYEAFISTRKCLEKKDLSFAPQLKDFLDALPEKMKEAAEVAKTFDPEKFKNVIAFAQAGNGNRPIPVD